MKNLSDRKKRILRGEHDPKLVSGQVEEIHGPSYEDRSLIVEQSKKNLDFIKGKK